MDTNLNTTLMIITRRLKSIQIYWLSTLSHIDPPHLRMKFADLKLFTKFVTSNIFMRHDNLNHPTKRLKSEIPHLGVLNSELHILFNPPGLKSRMVKFITKKQPSLSRPSQKVKWNRIISGAAPCNYLKNKWGTENSPLCRCGLIRTPLHITDEYKLTKLPNGIKKLSTLKDYLIT
ncbi:hypothetical protein RF11_07083 [Thelohanellus kitauei]|uniref:Uncharacterized protein n=1 Tax=Thelohanellus kitauei TaxID=669202 RepID=A0A0C2M568_THEKT|nr:hypothetical protein RF11_07083 [Thelohanellus kitauei]